MCAAPSIFLILLYIRAGPAVSGSVPGLQGPKGADATLPHCADRGGDLLL